MPELPEVETTRRGLALRLEGRRIDRIEARRPDLRFPLPKDFAARIRGRRVEALERRAKYILRSEVHTSELPSLMRISYAVFCLKKKKTIIHNKLPMKIASHHNKC